MLKQNNSYYMIKKGIRNIFNVSVQYNKNDYSYK